MVVKYKVHEVAKDFDVKSNAVVDLLKKFSDTAKKSPQYTPFALIRLLASGLYLSLPKKNRRKLMAKCLLLKKKSVPNQN